MKNERLLQKERDRLTELLQGHDVFARMDPIVALYAARQTLDWVLGAGAGKPSKAFPELAPLPSPRPEPAGVAEIEAAALAFLNAHPDADQVHAIVDTAPVGGEPVPHLNLWAFRCTADTPFEALLAEAIERDDATLIEDALEELASALDCLDLSGCYWDWPRALDDGADVVTTALGRAAAKATTTARLYFGYAGDPDLQRLDA